MFFKALGLPLINRERLLILMGGRWSSDSEDNRISTRYANPCIHDSILSMDRRMSYSYHDFSRLCLSESSNKMYLKMP